MILWAQQIEASFFEPMLAGELGSTVEGCQTLRERLHSNESACQVTFSLEHQLQFGIVFISFCTLVIRLAYYYNYKNHQMVVHGL